MKTAEAIVDESSEPARLRSVRTEGGTAGPELVLKNPVRPEPLAVVVERHIQTALAYCGGNKSQTARLLGIDRRTLYRRLEKGSEECPSPKSQPRHR